MANAKIISFVDAAVHLEAQERLADRAALIRLLEDEINELHDAMGKLTLRIELLEAGAPPG